MAAYKFAPIVNIDQFFVKHKVRLTAPRRKMIRVFLENEAALTNTQLEAKLGKDFDRVTLYRNLISFEESGMIHKIPGDDGYMRYALCDNCDVGHHHDGHVHFSCKVCGDTTCLDDVAVPDIKLPAGYRLDSAEMLISGTCIRCNG